jgi:hypothetical protein
MHHTLNPSPLQHLLEDFLHMDDASVLLCVTHSSHALLPMLDESAMNFVGLGDFLDLVIVFRSILACWE